MRDIRFRAWDKVNNKMLSHKDMLDGSWDNWPTLFFAITDNDIYIPMQFTGLHDSQGKEIYESDLVRCGGKCMDERKYKENRIGMMGWSEMHRGFNLFLRNKNSWCYPNQISYVPDTLEVIGNIYENPNLIKEG